MKITCENCGTGIDIEKDKRCPNCGASYSNNKEYKELKATKQKHTDYDFREREADIRTKELGNQMIEKTLETQKKFRFVPIIAMLIVIAIIAFTIYNIYDFNKTSKTEEYTIQFNETAETTDFDIKCDEVTKYVLNTLEEKTKPDDIDYYNFHIVFNNKSDRWASLNKITLTYTDDKGNENISANNHMQNTEEMKNGLPFFATNKVAYSGNVTFEIPTYVNDVTIIYEGTKIEIKNFKDNIK